MLGVYVLTAQAVIISARVSDGARQFACCRIVQVARHDDDRICIVPNQLCDDERHIGEAEQLFLVKHLLDEPHRAVLFLCRSFRLEMFYTIKYLFDGRGARRGHTLQHLEL